MARSLMISPRTIAESRELGKINRVGEFKRRAQLRRVLQSGYAQSRDARITATDPVGEGLQSPVWIHGRAGRRTALRLPAAGARAKVGPAVFHSGVAGGDGWQALSGGAARPHAVGAQRGGYGRDRAEARPSSRELCAQGGTGCGQAAHS